LCSKSKKLEAIFIPVKEMQTLMISRSILKRHNGELHESIAVFTKKGTRYNEIDTKE
jgi:hypothetical protein